MSADTSSSSAHSNVLIEASLGIGCAFMPVVCNEVLNQGAASPPIGRICAIMLRSWAAVARVTMALALTGQFFERHSDRGSRHRLRAGQGQSVPACRRAAAGRLSPARQPGGLRRYRRPGHRGAGRHPVADGRRPGSRGARRARRRQPRAARRPPARRPRPGARHRGGAASGEGVAGRLRHRRRVERRGGDAPGAGPFVANARLPAAELAALALRLGADVPACLAARPVWVGGVGEQLEPAADLPPAGIVLANPRRALPTAAVFRERRGRFSASGRFAAMPADAAGLAATLASRAQRPDRGGADPGSRDRGGARSPGAACPVHCWRG